MINNIDWSGISSAIEWYVNDGYQYKEVPWIVSPTATAVTLPEGRTPLSCGFGHLVGSAEQSFIQLLIDGQPFEGKFVAVTPCFRDDALDDLHQRTFGKVELIEMHQGQSSWARPALGRMLKEALYFFGSIGGEAYPVSTKDGFDIELNGIEIGSYGIRAWNGWTWVYGTGYATPRFSIAKEAVSK